MKWLSNIINELSEPHVSLEAIDRKHLPNETIYDISARLKRNMGFLGFPKYWVTKYGHVWSEYRNDWLKFTLSDSGHLRMTIKNKTGKKQNIRLHRLLALAFITIPKYLQNMSVLQLSVHHLDENKLNNNIIPNRSRMVKCNLEWVLLGSHTASHHRADGIKKSKLCELLGVPVGTNLADRFKTGEDLGKKLLTKVSHTAALNIVDSPLKGLSIKTRALFKDTAQYLKNNKPSKEFKS